MKISMNKRYRTRDGRKVRIYAVDGGGGTKVHGAIWCPQYQGYRSAVWSILGRRHIDPVDSADDLVKIPKTLEVDFWVCFFSDSDVALYTVSNESKERSIARFRNLHSAEPYACIHIKRTVEEGEGL